MTATNRSTLASATHIPIAYGFYDDFMNSLAGDSGPMSPTTQTITWSEKVNW